MLPSVDKKKETVVMIILKIILILTIPLLYTNYEHMYFLIVPFKKYLRNAFFVLGFIVGDGDTQKE